MSIEREISEGLLKDYSRRIFKNVTKLTVNEFASHYHLSIDEAKSYKEALEKLQNLSKKYPESR